MMLQQSGLKIKLTVPIVSLVVLVLSVTIFLQSRSSLQVAREEAYSKATEMGYRYGNEVDAQLEVAMDAARTLAQVFEAVKMGGAKFPMSRDAANELLKGLLERNAEFLGVWCCWEPDAFDGDDKSFAGQPGHDSTGRFIPYWNRGSGKAVQEPLVDYTKPGSGDYYLLARNSGQETLLEP